MSEACVIVYGDPEQPERLQEALLAAKDCLQTKSIKVLQSAKLTYLDKNRLGAALLSARGDQIPLTVVCGGTGVGPEDIVPQTVAEIAEYEVPGVGEKLRRESEQYSPAAWIGRGGAWVSGPMVILAIPGSPNAIRESLEIAAPLLPKLFKARRGQCDKRP